MMLKSVRTVVTLETGPHSSEFSSSNIKEVEEQVTELMSQGFHIVWHRESGANVYWILERLEPVHRHMVQMIAQGDHRLAPVG